MHKRLLAGFLLPACLWVTAPEVRGGSITYTYDVRNRLTQAAYNTNLIYTIRHDDAGNVVRFVTAKDQDNDQIPDDYELWYWGDLTTATTNSDSDGDGLTDRQELLTGTDPDDPLSIPRAGVDRSDPAGGIRVVWASDTNRFYRVDRATNLISGGFVPWAEHVPGTPPLNILTDPAATNDQPLFYRIFLELND